MIGDFSPVDSLVVLVRLESFALRANDATAEFSPDRIAMRALSAIPIGMTEVPAAIERERKFLMEDDRAWARSGSSDHVVDSDFDKLDDLRRVLDSLEKVKSRIVDSHVRAEVADWLSLEEVLRHGPEVAAKGRAMLANDE